MKTNIRQQHIILSFILIFSTIPLAIAQTDRSSVILDTVVVTAEQESSTLQTGDVDTEQIPGFFSIIRQEQFEGKLEDVSGIIEKEAGVQIRQSGGLGSFSTVSLRGSSENQVMVFMDGILLNDASGGGVDLSNISLSDIQSIEIYRGITPVNFGKASIGGAVNIKTLRSEKGFNGSASAGYGSFDTRKLSAFINHKPDKWDYLISGDYLTTDNDFEFLNDNGTEWNTSDDTWEHRNNARFDQKNVLAKLGYDFTDNVRVDVVNQWFSKDQHLPNWKNSSKTNTSLDTERNITTLKLTANNLGPCQFNTSTRLSYSRKKEVYDDSGGHVGLSGNELNQYITTRYDAGFFLEWLTKFNIFSFTTDVQYEEYEPENLLDITGDSNENTRNTFSLGLQDSLLLFQDKLIITPALRYTFFEDESENDDLSRDEEYLSPQIGVKYRISDIGIVLKANVAKYEREPSFFELFGDRGFFKGNEDLKSEKGTNFDTGFEINRISDYKWLKRFSFHAIYFRSDVDDLITRVYDAQGIGTSKNISSSLIEGVETGIRMDFLKYFKLVVNATWQDTENQSENKDANGKKLPGRFEKSYMGRLEGHYKGIKPYVEYIVEKDMYYDSPNLLKAEDKEEINAGISWLFRSFLFTMEAKNLGDDHYEDFNSYPMPGRSYSFSVKYEF